MSRILSNHLQLRILPIFMGLLGSNVLSIPREAITVYMSFDQTVQYGDHSYAQIDYPPANGLDTEGPDPVLSSELPFPGWGKSLYIDETSGPITYANIPATFQQSQGTVSFWFKPFMTDQLVAGVKYEGPGMLWNAIQITVEFDPYPDPDYNQYFKPRVFNQYSNGYFSPIEWFEKWHHLAVTWHDRRIQLFSVDGNMLPMGQTIPPTELVGCIGDNSLLFGSIMGWYDEFVTFDRALTEQELRELGPRVNGDPVPTIRAQLGAGFIMKRRVFKRGEEVDLEYWGPPSWDMDWMPDPVFFVLEDHAGNRVATFTNGILNTREFSPGEYSLSLFCGLPQLTKCDQLDIVIRPEDNEGIGFGAYPIDKDLSNKQLFQEMEALHIDHMWLPPSLALRRTADEAYAHGISIIPDFDLNEIPEKTGVDHTTFGQQVIDNSAAGFEYVSTPCPRSTAAHDLMKQYLLPFVDRLSGYPGFSVVNLDDEYGLYINDARHRGCYSKECIDYFNQVTQNNLHLVDLGVANPPGHILPDDNLHLRWASINGIAGGSFNTGLRGGRPSLLAYTSAMADAVHSVAPDVQVSRLIGSSGGALDIQVVRSYPTNFDASKKGGGTWAETELMTAMHADLARSRLGQEELPLWHMIGWFWEPPVVDIRGLQNSLKLTAYAAIAGGCDALQVAPAFSRSRRMYGSVYQSAGEFLEEFGPWLHTFKPEYSSVGLYYSDISEQMDALYAKEDFALEQTIRNYYSALMLIGVRPTFLSDQDFLDGQVIASNLPIILAPGLKYVSESILGKLKTYSVEGGKLYCDDASLVAQVSGAQLLQIQGQSVSSNGPTTTECNESDWARSHTEKEKQVRTLLPMLRTCIAEHLPYPYRNEFIARMTATNGNMRNVYLLNTDLWDEQKVSIPKDFFEGGVLYDPTIHEEVSMDEGAFFTATIGPGDWKLITVLPTRFNVLSVNAPRLSSLQFPPTIRIQIRRRVGGNISTLCYEPIPIRVNVYDPNGDLTEYGGYFATENGVLNLTIPFAKNDKQGDWMVDVEELLSGRKSSRRIYYYQ